MAIYNAFYGNTRITSATVSENFIYLGEAFGGCTALKQVTLPRSLKYIGYGTFKESGITSIVIPEGGTDIGDNSFKDCANLTSVTLPRSLKRIGSGAFENCTSLTDVRIPSGSAITYGQYTGYLGSRDGIEVEKALSDFSNQPYFAEEQESVTSSGSFKGCTGLSADSRQTIRDSGYEGEF